MNLQLKSISSATSLTILNALRSLTFVQTVSVRLYSSSINVLRALCHKILSD